MWYLFFFFDKKIILAPKKKFLQIKILKESNEIKTYYVCALHAISWGEFYKNTNKEKMKIKFIPLIKLLENADVQ